MSDIVKILTNITNMSGVELSPEAAFRYRELINAPETDKQDIAKLLAKKTTSKETN